MTRFWILLPFFVQFLSDSICNPITCGDLSLQHVFLLVPPAFEIPGLTKFLANLSSATLLQAPEDDGLVEVICDSKDWDEVYRYTLDHNLRPVHTAFCVNQGDLDGLRRNKLRKLEPQNSLDNSERRNVRDESSVDVEDAEAVHSRVLRGLKHRKMSNTPQFDSRRKMTVKKSKTVGKRSLDGVDRFYEDDEEKIVSRRAATKKKPVKKGRKTTPKDDVEATTVADEGDAVSIRNDDSEDTTINGEDLPRRKKGKGKGKKKPKPKPTTVPYAKERDIEDNDCGSSVTPDLLGELGEYLRNIVNWVRKLKNRHEG